MTSARVMPVSRRSAAEQRGRRLLVAFTLLELLIVVAIIAVMAAAGVPAIRNIIYTSTASMAETQLKLALNAARDLAIRNASGDTAAVFTFEPGGRISVVGMVYAGRLLDFKDPSPAGGPTKVYRDVFVPTPLIDPVQLPPGWMVRGFAPPGTIYFSGALDINGAAVVQNGWYHDNISGAKYGNRLMNVGTDPLIQAPNRGNWVFPETGFYDSTKSDEGDFRQTFMVRFQSGSGKVMPPDAVPSVALPPRERIDTVANPSALPGSLSIGNLDWRRVDRADNLVSWARGVLALGSDEAALLIGARSTDCVTVSPVLLLGLYEESRMAFAIGAIGLNKVTGTIYGTTPGTLAAVGAQGEVPKAPNIDLALWQAGTSVKQPIGATEAESVQILINSYMIGALKAKDVFTGLTGTAANAAVDSDVRLFTLDSSFGNPTEARK